MDPADAAGSQLLPLTPDVITDTWPAGDELAIDELTFKIYHTPVTRRAASACPAMGCCSAGDTLFAGSCGRTDFPGGSMQGDGKKACPCWQSCRCPMQQKVLPGHEDFTTLGQERRSNPYE